MTFRALDLKQVELEPRPMRVADYIAQALVRFGVRHAFMITGGGAMHLNDALGRVEGLEVVFCHHEQALSMAAESYTRLSNRIACVNVTTGPGGINALNGVHGAYTDSIAMLVLSGQVKRETLRSNTGLALRQLGDQEADIVAMARPVTKWAEIVSSAADVRYLLEKALHLATTGRPGPVWLDIPIDIQGAPIEPDRLRGFDPALESFGRPFAIPGEQGAMCGAALEAAARKVVERLAAAERPVLLPGTGVRISGAHELFLQVAERIGAPVAPGWNAQDVVDDDNPLYVGRPGTVGDRAGNFAVQNADALLVLGCRLNIRQISFNYASFARAAFKMMVDVDRAEMMKPTLSIDLPVHADLRDFLTMLLGLLDDWAPTETQREWLAWAQARRRRYPAVLERYRAKDSPVNPYVFTEALFERLDPGEVIVMANATAAVVTVQAAKLKPGQRLYSNSGSASMGYDLPAAIGAWKAMQGWRSTDLAGGGRVICIAGDGSIMMNLQELQTLSRCAMPVKIFLYNNDGYHSIRQSQDAHFKGRPVGCGPESGVGFPDFEKIAYAFDIPFVRTASHADMGEAIARTLAAPGPAICEIITDKAQAFEPKLSSRKLPDGTMVTAPLEDLSPFLPREELKANMLIPLLPDSLR